MEIRWKLRQINRKNRERGKKHSIYFDKGNGQWGYYLNVNIENVINYLNENDLKTIIDLGAGEGHIVELLNDMGFNAKGYEIEELFIENHNKEFGKGNVTKKDIMYLTSDDIKDFEVIYFYQPFKDKHLMEQFLTNIYNIAQPNQTILFETDGSTFTLAETTNTKTEKIKKLEIFKKQ